MRFACHPKQNPEVSQMNEQCESFWKAYLNENTLASDTKLFEVFFFTESKEHADYLAEAAISGIKTGTASLLWHAEASGAGVPEVGVLSMVTFANGDPACIIKTVNVDIVPFKDVSEAFAATEGESNPSLAHWRTCHWREFADQCSHLQLEAHENMPVICEEFKVVYSVTKITRATR